MNGLTIPRAVVQKLCYQRVALRQCLEELSQCNNDVPAHILNDLRSITREMCQKRLYDKITSDPEYTKKLMGDLDIQINRLSR